MKIREARTGELDVVSAILDAAWREYDALVTSPPERVATFQGYRARVVDVRSRLGDGSIVLVADDDGELTGTVTYYPPEGVDPDDWPPGFAAIRLLGVLPAARGRGIGRALTEDCLRRARAAGATHVGLHTTELMGIARDMYLRMGFERAPEHDFRVDDGFVVEGYRLVV